MPYLYWGKGKRSGSFTPGLTRNGIWYLVVVVWTNGYIELQFQHLQRRPPFGDEAQRRELLRRFNEIPGVSLPTDSINRRPGIPLSAFKDSAALDRFLQVLDWFVEQVRAG